MKVVTFGEIMLRLKTPENLRIMQSDGFEASYGGAEANVAVSLAMYEDKCAFVSIVLNWIENNMNENPKDIVNKVSNLVTGTIKHACLAINSNI